MQALLREAGVKFTVNPQLVRGLDYYNDTVFEWTTRSLGAQGALCAGGRYDGLFEQIGGKPAPACGFALGIERVLELLQATQTQTANDAEDVYLVHQGAMAQRYAFMVAEQLRDHGLTVIFDGSCGSFKSQMKKADSSGVRFAVIIGDDEANARQVTVKPLRINGAQTKCTVAQAVELIKNR
jgi:histidyl-tRNA synthetase